MPAKNARNPQYFHHIFKKYLRWATFVLSLKVTAFIILEKSRGAFLHFYHFYVFLDINKKGIYFNWVRLKSKK